MKRIIALIIAVMLWACAGAEQMLAASGAHALYLDNDGCVWAWGSNQKGESSPANADARVLLPEKVAEGVKAVACGRQFSVLLGDDGVLRLWGSMNNEISGVKQVSACEDICALVMEDGSARILTTDGEITVFESGIVSCACGSDFTLFLDEAGVCHMHSDTQTVLMENVSAVYANGQTGMLVSDGKLYVFGASGSEGRLGIDSADWIEEPVENGVENVKKGVPGVSASGALTQDGEFYAWGMLYSYVTAFDDEGNAVASLVDGGLIPYGKTPIVLYTGVKDAAIGDAFIVLLLSDGLLAWGSNDQGQCAGGYYTACSASLEEDDEGETTWEIEITDNNQCIFPVFVNIGH